MRLKPALLKTPSKNGGITEPLAVPENINEVCKVGFMHGQLDDGRSIRLFNATCDYNREDIDVEVDFSLPVCRVIQFLGSGLIKSTI